MDRPFPVCQLSVAGQVMLVRMPGQPRALRQLRQRREIVRGHTHHRIVWTKYQIHLFHAWLT